MDTAPQEELLLQLYQCVGLLQRGKLQAARQGGGMEHKQGRLLYLLNQMEGASQKDLANVLDSRPASVSELIDRLERLELVDRRRGGSDRRKVNLFLTQKGKDTVPEATAARDTMVSELFADFTEEEMTLLRRLMAKMLRKLEVMNGLGAPDGAEK